MNPSACKNSPLLSILQRNMYFQIFPTCQLGWGKNIWKCTSFSPRRLESGWILQFPGARTLCLRQPGMFQETFSPPAFPASLAARSRQGCLFSEQGWCPPHSGEPSPNHPLWCKWCRSHKIVLDMVCQNCLLENPTILSPPCWRWFSKLWEDKPCQPSKDCLQEQIGWMVIENGWLTLANAKKVNHSHMQFRWQC